MTPPDLDQVDPVRLEPSNEQVEVLARRLYEGESLVEHYAPWGEDEIGMQTFRALARDHLEALPATCSSCGGTRLFASALTRGEAEHLLLHAALSGGFHSGCDKLRAALTEGDQGIGAGERLILNDKGIAGLLDPGSGSELKERFTSLTSRLWSAAEVFTGKPIELILRPSTISKAEEAS